MKIGRLFILFMFIAVTSVQAQAPLEQPKDPLYVDLSKALAYIKGQRFSLNRIKREYPNSALYAQKADLEFKASFGTAEKNISKALEEIFQEKYSKYLTEMEKQFETILSSQQWNSETATNFIAEVESRVKGNLPSPILETLLTYQFMEHPEEEFTRGYNRVFRTKGHLKVKGLDFQIRHPISWRAQEGERPNVIQKFISENGRGSEMVGLMVTDIGYTPSEQELSNFFSPRELKGMVPDGAKFISAKQIVLDNHKGGMFIYDMTKQRLDMTITMRIISFVTLSGKKLIFIQCNVSTLNGRESELQGLLKKFEPLFKMIANSFIIQEQYK